MKSNEEETVHTLSWTEMHLKEVERTIASENTRFFPINFECFPVCFGILNLTGPIHCCHPSGVPYRKKTKNAKFEMLAEASIRTKPDHLICPIWLHDAS
jgi:hypothetical protein